MSEKANKQNAEVFVRKVFTKRFNVANANYLNGSVWKCEYCCHYCLVDRFFYTASCYCLIYAMMAR